MLLEQKLWDNKTEGLTYPPETLIALFNKILK